ncbi:hypothetical protein GPALN_005050 [Globodera pallida]|nr:hypothetical protein GPALN_005050 [Globodera pallida]
MSQIVDVTHDLATDLWDWPLQHEDGVVQVHNGHDCWEINLSGDHLFIYCHHEERVDEHGWVKRELHRSYKVPEDVDTGTIRSHFTPNGILQLKALKKHAARRPSINVAVIAEKEPKKEKPKYGAAALAAQKPGKKLVVEVENAKIVSWALTTSLSVLLALERCAEQTFPNLAKTLFAGRRIWGWILAVLAYSIYYGFFTIPLTFSGLTANWQFDPHVGYLDNSNGQNLYWNSVDVIHTIVVAIALPTLYLLFVVMLSLKLTQITKLPMAEQKMRKSVFVQVFVLSSALTVFAVNYTLLNFVSVPDIMVSINMYLWVLLDGVPPLIYLSLNASIRAECLRILRRRNSQQKLVTTFGRHSRRTHLAMGTMNEFMPTKMIVNNFVDSHI